MTSTPKLVRRTLLTSSSQSHNAQRRLFATLHHSQRSEEDVHFVQQFLSSELLFFQELPELAQRAIAANAICQHIRPGKEVIRHNDNALAFYLVWSGSGTIFRHGIEDDPDRHATDQSTELDRRHKRMYGNETVRVIKGDTFGEEGLLKRLDQFEGDVNGHECVPASEASITVVADPTEGMCVLVMDFLLFTRFIYPRRKTLCFAPSHCIKILGTDSIKRTPEQLEMVRRFVARIAFFQQLSKEHQLELCRAMRTERHYQKVNSVKKSGLGKKNSGKHIGSTGDARVIFQEGWTGNNFYVIVSGVVSVHQQLTKKEQEIKKQKEEEYPDQTAQYYTDVAKRFHRHESSYGPAVAELRHGDSFGEQALHGIGVFRNASIICQSKEVLLMVIDRESYIKIIKPKSTCNSFWGCTRNASVLLTNCFCYCFFVVVVPFYHRRRNCDEYSLGNEICTKSTVV
jgi:CRP-like cAMP-binding protein